MIRPDYWNIKPHTERKLIVLRKYLNSWCDIIFSYYKKNQNWEAWKSPFYVDCFSGRGMYHKNGNENSIDGSPLIAIKILLNKKIELKEEWKIEINPKIRLVEYDHDSVTELQNFVASYKEQIDIKVFPNDFNEVIGEIVAETGISPAFFFVDAGGIKELKKESVDMIVSKNGARDILLNYVVDGPSRIGGLAKSIFDGTYKGKQLEGAFKTIEQLEDFTGIPVYKYLEETSNDNKEALLNYVTNILHANNNLKDPNDRLHTVVYDMKDLKRHKLIYYLLFSSRKQVATNIMKAIFTESKKNEGHQASLFNPDILEI